MSFDTLWDVDKYKSDHECEEHWQFRRAFLDKHKNRYQEDRLVSLAQIFFNVEFLGCRYPQQTMALIESLSKGLVDSFREKRKEKLQRTFVVASDAAISKAKGIRQITAPNKNNNQLRKKNMKIPTLHHPEYILPGFMLLLTNSEDPFEILDRSCSFCNIAKPLVKFDKSNCESDPPIIKADLYIQNKLIASGSGSSQKTARKDVSKIAYDLLKDICFTIKVKELQEKEIPIHKSNVCDGLELTNNSTPLNSTNNEIIENNKSQTKLSEDNIGNKLLKSMGWKEGVGLGKNCQGRLDPIEVVQLPKHLGLGNKNKPIGSSARQKIMFALQREIKIHIMEFTKSPKKRLTFSTEFTKEERQLIHVICLKFGLKTKSYGQNENRHIVIFKKENSQEVFEELINNGLENDYYKLIPPKN